MNKIKLFLLLIICVSSFSFVQKIDYEALKLELEKNNNWEKSMNVSGESSWIEEWTVYLYNDSYYVLIETQDGKSYIFCGVPEINLNSFSENDQGSWGKSYHEYIKQYKCD